ncbi:MAG: hypothetical protein R3338_14785, partial [Thermoanaerobaculia bacterium]|nr:hypothetical protein [Thermoanaerobaculia bacterium]
MPHLRAGSILTTGLRPVLFKAEPAIRRAGLRFISTSLETRNDAIPALGMSSPPYSLCFFLSGALPRNVNGLGMNDGVRSSFVVSGASAPFHRFQETSSIYAGLRFVSTHTIENVGTGQVARPYGRAALTCWVDLTTGLRPVLFKV